MIAESMMVVVRRRLLSMLWTDGANSIRLMRTGHLVMSEDQTMRSGGPAKSTADSGSRKAQRIKSDRGDDHPHLPMPLPPVKHQPSDCYAFEQHNTADDKAWQERFGPSGASECGARPRGGP